MKYLGGSRGGSTTTTLSPPPPATPCSGAKPVSEQHKSKQAHTPLEGAILQQAEVPTSPCRDAKPLPGTNSALLKQRSLQLSRQGGAVFRSNMMASPHFRARGLSTGSLSQGRQTPRTGPVGQRKPQAASWITPCLDSQTCYQNPRWYCGPLTLRAACVVCSFGGNGDLKQDSS